MTLSLLLAFSSYEEAEDFANDQEVKDHYGGTLDEGDFEICEVPIFGGDVDKLKKHLEIIQ